MTEPSSDDARHPFAPHPLAWTPNALTLARVALAPLIAAALIAGPATLAGADALARAGSVWPLVAGGLLALAGVFDFLDGKLARVFKAESAFGVFWDPVADKLVVAAALVGGAFVYASMAFLLPAALLLWRDAAVTWLRRQPRFRDAVLAPTRLAKWKTAVEFAALLTVFLSRALADLAARLAGADRDAAWNGALIAGHGLLWIAAGLSLWTGGRYAAAAFAARR